MTNSVYFGAGSDRHELTFNLSAVDRIECAFDQHFQAVIDRLGDDKNPPRARDLKIIIGAALDGGVPDDEALEILDRCGVAYDQAWTLVAEAVKRAFPAPPQEGGDPDVDAQNGDDVGNELAKTA